jgi:hypothetical protein
MRCFQRFSSCTPNSAMNFYFLTPFRRYCSQLFVWHCVAWATDTVVKFIIRRNKWNRTLAIIPRI